MPVTRQGYFHEQNPLFKNIRVEIFSWIPLTHEINQIENFIHE